MTKRYTNKKHSLWIAEQGCILEGHGQCDGGIQGHHLMKPWHGVRGTGLRANDKNLVPLCAGHHRALHAAGNEDLYFENLTGHPSTGKNSAQFKWLGSPHYEPEET